MARLHVTRSDAIAFRVARHQLDRAPRSTAPTDVDLLDLGVQDTGTGGSAWALEIRGAQPTEVHESPQPPGSSEPSASGAARSDADPAADPLVMVWSLRGAPHVYRRADVADVVVATAPYSEADAASRVFDASKPLRDHGIAVLEALATVATAMRDIARTPIDKGAMSTALTERLDPPYLRDCRVCKATHIYEQPFRLSALQAGLELRPDTSPPVLARIPGLRPPLYRRAGSSAAERFDVIRGYLRFYAPATVKAIATFLEAPVAVVKANLPDDAIEVEIDELPSKAPRYVLAGDLERLQRGGDTGTTSVVRLLGSHDPYLQTRDRDVLVGDAARQKDLWRVLGRPGAVMVGGEVVGTWRPRASGQHLSIAIDPWRSMTERIRKDVQAEAERLAAHRGLTLRSVDGL